jgi:uncharacterized protein (TIGR02145 family)
MVDGLAMTSQSLAQVFQGIGETDQGPNQAEYEIEGNGDYSFVQFTGLPRSGVMGAEVDQAFYRNAGLFGFATLTALLPKLAESPCLDSMVSALGVFVQGSVSLDTLVPAEEMLGQILENVVGQSLNNLDPCVMVNLHSNYFEQMGKFYALINQPLGGSDPSLSSSVFVSQWALADPVRDTCFSAWNEVVEPCIGCPEPVTDIDGNEYCTVQIGSQVWLGENLKVEHYRNGDPIITGLSDFEWESTITGAFVYYDNLNINKEIYGPLYNWYAVADPRGLCPTGWHVPTDDEWFRLAETLGGLPIAGGSLKAVGTLEEGTGFWRAPNFAATDSTGFSAIPGGYCTKFGNDFRSQGSDGQWWTSTESWIYEAWVWEMHRIDAWLGRVWNEKRYGNSVRCLKD